MTKTHNVKEVRDAERSFPTNIIEDIEQYLKVWEVSKDVENMEKQENK